MGVYTFDLSEVLARVPKERLFKPIPFIDYPRVVDLITGHFIDREIAYDSIDKFAVELNIRLTLACNPYNKMLKSELAEIDPFMTDYMVNEGSGSSRYTGKTASTENKSGHTVRHDKNSEDVGFSEDYKDATNSGYEKENASVGTKGLLSSATDNRSTDTTVDRTRSHNYTENYDGQEDTDYDSDITDNTSTAVKTTDTQTGRDWTENGSSNSHILDVHSDTPQAMLFNEPNHYTGTGRANNHGIAETDSSGNEYYAEYPETTPEAIDTEGWTINEGDTPWYNYASDANNKTAHDSYKKAGTETYSKGGSSDTTENETKKQSDTKVVKTEYEKTLDEDEQENTTTSVLDSNAHNANEHSKEDSKTNESYEDETKRKYNKTNSKFTTINNVAHSAQGVETTQRGNENRSRDTTSSYTRKGRNNQSPSKLLNEYRSTLPFSADWWLFGELEPLFLQLY